MDTFQPTYFFADFQQQYLADCFQFVFFEESGRILNSNNSFMDFTPHYNKNVYDIFPFLESIKGSIELLSENTDKVFFPRIEIPLGEHEGIFDYTIKLLKDSIESKKIYCWIIQDNTLHNKYLYSIQKQRNELLIEKELDKSAFARYKMDYLVEKKDNQVLFFNREGKILYTCKTLIDFNSIDGNVFNIPFIESIKEIILSTNHPQELNFPRMELYSDSGPEAFNFILKSVNIGGMDYFVWIINRIIEDYSFLQNSVNDKKIGWIEKEFLQIKNQKIALEKELINLKNEELERTREFKNNFFSSASHELRTPVNSIVGLADLVLQSASEEQKEYLNAMKQISRQLVSITNDLLDLSKIESGKFTLDEEDFNLSEILNSLRLSFKHQVESKGLQLKISVDPAISIYLLGDSTRLMQILINLLSNALKFTEKGYIELSVNFLANTQDGYQLEFIVKDSGIGIAPEKLINIFEPFNQGGKDVFGKFGGTGLGLTIVKELVGIHGGEIEVKSMLNVGTQFNLMIPYKKSTKFIPNYSEEQERKLNKLLLTLKLGLKILAVEDNAINLKILTMMLEKWGFEVIGARNGQDAMEKLKTTSQVDLILMDLEMPIMDGYNATKFIREYENERYNKLPIILLSAYSFEIISHKLDGIEITDFITKPVEKVKLLEKLIEYLPKQDLD